MRIATVVIATVLSAALAVPALAQSTPAPGGAPPQSSGASAGGGGAKLDVTPFFDAVDTNKDGKITLEEWKAAGLKDDIFTGHFDTEKKGYFTKEFMASMTHPGGMDANQDGKLTLEEFKAFFAKNSGGGAGPKEGDPKH